MPDKRPDRKEYFKQYYQRNRDHVRDQQHGYSSDSARREERKKYYLEYRTKNKEEFKRKRAAHYSENRDRLLSSSKEWRQKNPDKVRQLTRDWRKRNRGKARVYSHNRRVRTQSGKLSKDIYERLFKIQKGRCACCSEPLGETYHLDHIVPLAKGGLNIDRNVQLLRASCNSRKATRDPIEFMQKERGKLL